MKKRLLAASAACLLSAVPSRAWGPLGHKAVADVAESWLSESTRERVRELLGGSLSDVSNCADNVMFARDPFPCAGFTLDPAAFAGTKPWHYIGIPIGTTDLSDMKALCKNGKDCVVAAIKAQTAVLKDPSPHVTKLQRQSALMLLVHLMGDVHQPFHAIDDGDWGGNAKKLTFKGAAKNLHMLWDDLVMVEDWKEQATWDAKPLVEALERPLDPSSAAPRSYRDVGEQAAAESFVIAKDIVYPAYARSQALDQAYQEQMQPIVGRRLTQAGLRLAFALESIFLRYDQARLSSAAPVRNAAAERALGMICPAALRP
ncbi:MAG: S1/P1 nuclease [Elusimicrobia bacterium]|nr:S1/P1 nuclease [Elusimicrobiota bacterium]